MDQLTLEAALTGLATGGLTYPVAKVIYRELDQMVVGEFSSQAKRWITYLLSLGLSFGGLGLLDLLGYSQVTPETVLTSFLAAFAASQALHGWLDLD